MLLDLLISVSAETPFAVGSTILQLGLGLQGHSDAERRCLSLLSS